MGGVGSVFMAIFGLIFLSAVSSMGAPPVFTLFAVAFVLLAVCTAIYGFYNALARNRMTEYDITDRNEEIDPIASGLGYQRSTENEGSVGQKDKPRKYEGDFCPFCGASVSSDFDFCPKCGKDI